MNLDFSEEQFLLRNLVERFTTDHYDLAKRAEYLKSPNGFSRKNWNLMADMGLFSVPFSEHYDGFGGHAEDLVCIMQPLGKAVAVEPLLSSVILSGGLLEAVGTPEQKNTWIPKIISGQNHGALAHSETSARFDLSHVETTYVLDGGRARLSGQKTFILGAASADFYIVSAVAEGSTPQSAEISFFLVKKDAGNLMTRSYRLTDGSIAHELDLDKTEAEPMAGTFADLKTVVATTKIAACAEIVGLLELLFEQTMEHLKTREQFGHPLSKMQVIQHRMADFFVSLELCKSHLLRLAASKKTDEHYVKMTSGSKSFIAKTAMTLAEESVQLHGGMGVTDELIIGHAMKRIMVLSNLFGDHYFELRSYMGPAA